MTTSRSTGLRNNRLLARLAAVAALLVAAWLLVHPSVAEARRRIVVLELEGDRAEDFQAELEKFLKKSHSVVPLKKWLATAEDLRATKVTDKNVRKVAAELSVDGVISGTVEKRGSRYYLRLTLRAGTDGKAVTTTELVERAPRFSGAGRETLTDELLAAIDELDASGDDEVAEDEDDDSGFGRRRDRADDDDRRLTAKEKAARAKAAREKAAREKAAREKAAREKAAREKRRDRDREDEEEDEVVFEDDEEEDDRGRGRGRRDRVADRDDDEDSPFDDEDIEMDGDVEPDDEDAVRDPRARPLDLAAGLSFTARRLTFDTAEGARAPLGYKSNPLAGVTVAADLFPLAFNRKNKSITRNLGLTFVVDRVIKVESQYQTGGMVYKLGSTEQHLGLGLVYRHLIGDKLTVTAGVRYNKRSFEIDRSAAPMPSEVDIPDVSYTYVDPGLGVRYLLGPKMALGADARFLIVNDTGALQTETQYGGTSSSGFDLGARFDYQVGAKLLVRAAAGMTRIGMTFDGTGTLTNNRDPGMDLATQDVNSATDTYFGGALTGVYLF